MPGIEGLLVGRMLGGRYRIEEVIGRGGMGAVYRAVDERLGREVALKVITVADTGEADARERLRARFFREARSAAALPHHPNVVPVYDYGSDESLGLDYLVMELLRGSDLSTRLARSGPPPLAASLRILIEAARGLAIGHDQGLIHRDVKPGNIFLAQTHGNDIQVRVVDFGIAKLADEEDTLAQLTQDGRVPHSPAYASPEQLRGLTVLTPAADVFSLGAVGFQLLTGERPFTESDRNRMSLGMPVEAPSVRARNPAVPASIEAVIRRALEFEPSERFPDAGAMASALEESMRGIAETTIEPYVAGPAISTVALDDDDRTRLVDLDYDRTRIADLEDDRTLAAPLPAARAGGSVAPAAAAAAGRRRARPTPARRARPSRESARGMGGKLVWLLVFAVVVAALLWAWSEMQQGPMFAIDQMPPAPDSIPIIPPDQSVEEPPTPTLLDAVINNQEGMRLYSAGRYEEAVEQFRRAVEIDPNSPDYRRNYGVTLLRLGRNEDAERELRRAIDLDPDRPTTYANLATALLAQRDTISAIAALEDHLARETNPVAQGRSERLLRELQRATAGYPPLLGEPIGRSAPAEEPGVAPPGGAPQTSSPAEERAPPPAQERPIPSAVDTPGTSAAPPSRLPSDGTDSARTAFPGDSAPR